MHARMSSRRPVNSFLGGPRGMLLDNLDCSCTVLISGSSTTVTGVYGVCSSVLSFDRMQGG